MKLQMLHDAMQAVAQGGRLSPNMLTWLRQLWTAQGQSPSQPLYGPGLWVDALGMYAIGGSVAYGAFVGSLNAVLLPAGSAEDLGFSVSLPLTYRDGSDVEPYALWAPVDANTGDVVLQLEISPAANGDVVPATTVLQVTDSVPGVADQVTRTLMVDSDGDPLSGTGREKGDLLLCRVARVGDDSADTYASNIALLGVGFRFPIDGAGELEAHP